ncbi:thiolase family protein (plasmid) [Haloferax mediterranei ATCC 33500]|uniref:acetyl-CoA C-acyltransferase n=1 Tax=Haloferax mediterranei (strain ATCC 33500 / DSM 1411 / JCM 8866 / NBRC 14739 / NCIMB 2177 / R-4) TaxID=523841 RepID=I3RB67_HALMT|nr:thiolase family protein [Haloferax mediterranei]AFK21477.1 acetyl-CoA C-acetyltransferase [Haloferax mediterranei ATCC 33500]AHZ24461.1 acetyl-CoA acetyltransferase [Haloferax mediterranei ATCC 33500]ELZ97208.1 acetyl-CoA C-acetyltransferase [Haloferax mediterranei ATCC 33500]MDX5990054.1 thiolase family protein [Haloferax mediterranei ATCC 33500]QCQ76859.1 thiolase family protein [Haloferax mediterranei ATCC 33500]
MSRSTERAVIVDAVRTPQAKKDGGFADVYPEDLVIAVLDALADRTGVSPDEWVDFRLGCANQENEQGRNLARQSLLAGGFPESVPGATLSRLCGSSLTTLNDAARAVESGDGAVYPIAGVEHMSRIPFSDWLHPDLETRYDGGDSLSMGKTAETVARRYDIPREDQDAFALRSHERAIEARKSGRFDAEIVPVETPDGLVEHDEGPREDTSMDVLESLPTVFADDEEASVTPGNASPLTDGAAGALVTSESYAEENDLPVLGRVVSRAVVGVDPEEMGVAPISATRAALDKAGLTVSDLDLVELNEAFASQSLYCKRELGIDEEKLNVNGGAIALGHPLGCSGARIATTLLHELDRRGGRYGLATMCVGFGQGVATVFERQ